MSYIPRFCILYVSLSFLTTSPISSLDYKYLRILNFLYLFLLLFHCGLIGYKKLSPFAYLLIFVAVWFVAYYLINFGDSAICCREEGIFHVYWVNCSIYACQIPLIFGIIDIQSYFVAIKIWGDYKYKSWVLKSPRNFLILIKI